MKLTEVAPLRDELLAKFEQRAQDSFLFKLIWMYSKTYGSTRAIASLPEQASVIEYCRATLSAFNLEIKSDIPHWLTTETGQGVLVYGPHASKLEPLILPALLGNREVYFVGVPESLFLLPNRLGNLMLPVSPSYLAADGPLSRNLKTRANQLINRKLLAHNDTRTAAKMKHDNSGIPLRAAQLLAEGKVVVIFPTASYPITTTPWRDGIGNTLIYLQEYNLQPNTVLLQSYTMTDIRFGQTMANMRQKYVFGKDKPPTVVEVSWNNPIDFARFDSQNQVVTLDAREVAQLLAADYLSQSK